MSHKTRSEQFSGGFPKSIEAFSELADPRKGRHKRHYFGEIIFMALAAIICQCEGFDDMERFAKLKESWFRKFLKLPNGTPSNDTFRRVFSTINPKQFNRCFMAFIRAKHGDLAKQLIAIDGKAVRHSLDTGTDAGHIHLLSAWACEKGISLGQLKVDRKTNEIKAVPEILDLLDLEGHTVSLDAMGCQKAIAQKIHLANAHYLLALKGNQGMLHKRVEDFFGSPGQVKAARQRGKTITVSDCKTQGHGRYERRIVMATDALEGIDKLERENWLGLESIVCVEAHREERSTGKSSVEKRYYITSHKPDAELLQKLIRQHWGIENQCHWILDVTWKEDASRIRKKHAAENVALLRKLALNILKADTSVKDTVRGKRLQATFCETILSQFLRIDISK
jgi:predicted transposase YbfD/YdcC